MSTKPTAIVTGSSSGIGQKLAIDLSDQYFVYLISRNKVRLDETSKLIEKKGNQSQIVAADISKESEVNAINSILDLSKIKLLVNNAGLFKTSLLQNTSVKDWDEQINVNLRGSFLMSRSVVPNMIENKSGKIVFINSTAGKYPFKSSSAYCASKFGLRGFASALREELREHNIKVISIFPGAVSTPIWDGSGLDLPKLQMMSIDNVSEVIFNAINAPGNCTIEEVDINRVQGNF